MDSTPVITGVSPINGIQIQTIPSHTVYIKLSGITINSSASRSNPAIRITGDGNAEIEFVGHNTLQSDNGHAGIQKENRGYLKMGGTGSLNVTGGMHGAGIGGGCNEAGTNIEIKESAKVMVAGGSVGNSIGSGAAIGDGGKDNGVSGNEIDPETYKSILYDTGFIKYYPVGTSAGAINDGTCRGAGQKYNRSHNNL